MPSTAAGDKSRGGRAVPEVNKSNRKGGGSLQGITVKAPETIDGRQLVRGRKGF